MSGPTADELKARRRSDYPFFLTYRTRWWVSSALASTVSLFLVRTKISTSSRSDNDQYAHVNNSIYYHFFDSIVNTYLITHCSLTPPNGALIGLVVHSFCHFFGPLSFPAVLDLGLRVNKVGKSSVTYEIGVFEHREGEDGADADKPSAVGGYTHVFVDSQTRKSSEMSAPIRGGLQKLYRPSRAKARL